MSVKLTKDGLTSTGNFVIKSTSGKIIVENLEYDTVSQHKSNVQDGEVIEIDEGRHRIMNKPRLEPGGKIKINTGATLKII